MYNISLGKSLVEYLSYYKVCDESYIVSVVAAVRLNRIVVPATGYSEKSLTLNCEFDLEGDELRSVKWFKDSEEFFRYMPNEIPKTISHRISGVQVDPGRTRCTDNSCLIVLNNLSSSSSSGRYQCEVTALHSEYRMAMKSSKVQIEESKGFRITNFTATTLYNTNKELELYCAFDLDKEELYALKFYRGVYEFFRYDPHREPSKMIFLLEGLSVNNTKSVCTSNYCSVYLLNFTKDNSGIYTCEVNSGAPTFIAISKGLNVTVDD
ncbi:hypothetical protein HHI36_006241 [Cryptolaemus montrouzieri]|uniref:Ig-like domain-containing protein n=1 Tax=Cryptolaemus montrouzieri TaxID=559131 RepID=A0ABD2NWM8_9CUCU